MLLGLTVRVRGVTRLGKELVERAAADKCGSGKACTGAGSYCVCWGRVHGALLLSRTVVCSSQAWEGPADAGTPAGCLLFAFFGPPFFLPLPFLPMTVRGVACPVAGAAVFFKSDFSKPFYKVEAEGKKEGRRGEEGEDTARVKTEVSGERGRRKGSGKTRSGRGGCERKGGR